MQELVKTQVMQREEEIKQESDNLIQYLKEREGDLQKQLADAKWQLDKLRATHNSTQAEILDQSQQADHDIIAKLAEMDILQSDIDRANGRIADLQAQNRSLHNEIQALKQGFGTDALVSEYRQQIEDQESDIARLMDEIEEIKHLLDIQEAKQQAKVEEMAAQIASKDKQIRSLEGVVRSREDYDEVKRELDILKSVEFAYSDWGMNDESNSQGEEPNQPLEKLLARKNKKLQDELVSIKARLSEVETDAAGYKESEEELRKTVAEKDVLIKKLEDSLSSFDSRQPEASMESEGPSNGASSASIIPIITDQRNRFKQRNSELEEELRMQQNAMADLRSQIDKLRRDNVKLYEETQYLRNYSARKATTYTSPSTSQRAEFDVDDGQSMPDTTVINIGAGRGRRGREAPDMDSSSNKYKDLYEESLNPFHRFHRREAARRFRSMNILDRGTLMVTRKVLTSRFGRYAVIIYASLLHFLVMAALYRLSRAKDCPGASNTPGDLPLN
ncbi:hypothetical protein EV182_005414 [Spiromyces aspiralis]|uniref:Uncharacterized protein n=1 Tax=Spiromyces aspiralis TaxID=68401 RepID=A0ACC1HV73_9FUNG|nr:hypothetical protein EV182_005414 [Spiromyces aspiralis]